MADSDRKRRVGGGGGEGGPRKKKGHYVASATGRSTSEKAIPLGAVGLLVTCDSGREYKAFDETIRLLEESFQRLGKDHIGRTTTQAAPAAPAAPAAAAAAAADGAGGGDDTAAAAAAAAADGGSGDAPAAAAAATTAGGGSSKAPSIADMIAAEVADIKKERVHRFRRHNTDVRGTLFIEFPKAEGCPTPEEVALEIAGHVKATRSLPARHLMKLLPVSLTCFASAEELKGVTAKMVEQYFGTDGDKPKEAADFAVEFEHRSSDKLKRGDVIDIVAKAVPQPPYKVNLNTPSRTILVQLVRNVAALSVVPSFKAMAKFNLRRLTEEEEEGEEGKQAAGAAGKAAAACGQDAGQPAAQAAAVEAAEEAAPAVADKDQVATAEAAAEAADKAE